MSEMKVVEAAIIGDEEEFGDDFYEKIEAPKFVDLAAPDRQQRVDDDRYWFCARVGCDRKHEEEMDSEEIYKNFVLRVMAARSPNVRLQKSLCRKNSSPFLKCPRTVPPKASKSRVSRLEMILSIPKKRVDDDAKAKVTRVIANKNSTPKMAKAGKQSSVAAKAMTTPRNKHKRISNQGAFLSARNPKTTTMRVPKDRVVAKALVFHSPKKVVKLKRSVDLSKICQGMKKLEITSKANKLGCDGKQLPVDGSRKQLKGREVKSRVFDSLHSRNNKRQEVKSPKSLKKKARGKEETKTCPENHTAREKHKSSGMEVHEKSTAGYLEACSTTGTYTSDKDGELKGSSDASRSDMTSLSNSENPQRRDVKFSCTSEVVETSKEGSNLEAEVPATTECNASKVNQDELTEADNKENTSAEEGKEYGNSNGDDGNRADEDEDMQNDDKENASASENNRKPDIIVNHADKRKVLGKQETCKTTQKVTEFVGKASNSRMPSVVTGAQRVKCTKLKPTNPKPFRLRTDERRILKEANTEKKLLAPVEETTGDLKRKHQGTSQGKSPKAPSTTPLRHPAPNSLKTKLEEASRLEESLKRTKPLLRKQATISSAAASGRKKRVAKANENEANSQATEAPVPAVVGTPSRGRRPLTVPEEPHFHIIHVPKSCTRRVA